MDNIANDSKPLIDSLTGWKIKSSVEKKLVLGILHSRGHKNFEEKEQDEHERFQSFFSHHLEDIRRSGLYRKPIRAKNATHENLSNKK